MVEFTKMSALPDEVFDYYGLDISLPVDHRNAARITHAIAVHVDSPKGMHDLTKAAIQQLYEEFHDICQRLGLKMEWKNEWSAYGRFSADVIDGIDIEELKLGEDHHVCAVPADEPDNGTWDGDWDIHVEHPERCTPEMRWRGECPWHNELAEWGTDTFGDLDDWGKPPFRIRARFDVHHYPSSPNGPAEWDVYIIPDHEGSTDA